jgi:hypothetical protein
MQFMLAIRGDVKMFHAALPFGVGRFGQIAM